VRLAEGNGDEDLLCKSLFTVCQRRLRFSEVDETIGWSRSFLGARIKLWYWLRRLERPVERRLGVFPEVFSVMDKLCEGSSGSGEPRVGSGLTPAALVDDWSMFIE